MITEAQIRMMMPDVTGDIVALLQAAAIDTPERIAAFMAHLACDGGDVAAACATWNAEGFSALADQNDFQEITRRITPTFEGWDRRVGAWLRNLEIAGTAQDTLLRLGDRGPAVITIQQALGLPPGGLFDEATDMAVRAFQAAQALTVDGVVGTETRAALGIGTE